MANLCNIEHAGNIAGNIARAVASFNKCLKFCMLPRNKINRFKGITIER